MIEAEDQGAGMREQLAELGAELLEGIESYGEAHGHYVSVYH